MLSAGAYLAGALELAVVLGSLALAATRLRARLLPAWDEAPARLAEAVIGLALLVWVGELLGVVGLLREWSLVALAAAVGLTSLLVRAPARRRGAAPPAASVEPLAMLIAIAVVGVLFAHWGLRTKVALNNGVSNFDSLWYHLPYAAQIAQSGSVTGFHHTDTVFLNWFYPQNSELIHAEGMLLTGRDTLSLFVNLGWLALILLAAWCVGRPWGRGPHCLAAAGLVLEAHTLIFREPGSGKNDVVAAALVLSAVALLVSGWTASRGRGTESGERGTQEALRMAPATLALAGLAAGLAAGTKLTVLATVAGLTVAVIALAAPGSRMRAAAVWLGPLLAGGAYWYLRNLIAVGNPLPQVRHLGPVTLPGPERLQIARPDFPIVHYATDTGVWRHFFGPGLHEAFGALWPLVLLAAIGGGALAIARRGYPLLQLLGGVALFGLAAYLVTPLSAAGEQGAPVAFAINIRFAIPALVIGLAVLPLGRGTESRRAAWALLVALIAVMAISDRSDAVLREPERAFGILVALLAVAIPALLILLRRRRMIGGAALGAAFAALAALVVAIGYPVQRDYLRSRWTDFDPEQHLDSAYRWAANASDARIGLAGTTTGFLGYGFYGKDLSNRVIYLGQRDPHGSFNAIRTCAGFRRAVDAADLDYLVTGPFLNFAHQSRPIFSPEAGWVRGEAAVRPVSRDGTGKARVTVWRIGGRLDPRGCERLRVPTTYLPQ